MRFRWFEGDSALWPWEEEQLEDLVVSEMRKYIIGSRDQRPPSSPLALREAVHSRIIGVCALVVRLFQATKWMISSTSMALAGLTTTSMKAAWPMAFCRTTIHLNGRFTMNIHAT